MFGAGLVLQSVAVSLEAEQSIADSIVILWRCRKTSLDIQ